MSRSPALRRNTPMNSWIRRRRKRDARRRSARPSRSIKVYDDTVTNGVEIHRRFRNPQAIFLTLFTIFWDGFMIVWFTIAIRTGELAMMAFGSVHGLIGLGLLYWVLHTWFNVTRVALRDDEIFITTAPVYRHAPRRIPLDQVEGIYVDQTSWSSNGKHHYNVKAALVDGSEKFVMGGVADYDDAIFVEMEIERFYNLPDTSFPGEIDPQTYY
jgi:hypothetical protein